MRSVHFHPIVRVVEYDRDIAFRTVGRTYTHPLEVEYLDLFQYVEPDDIDIIARTLTRSVDAGAVYSDDLTTLFYSTMFTCDDVCLETQAVLKRYGVRKVQWSDYRSVDLRGILSSEAVERYRRLIGEKYHVRLRAQNVRHLHGSQ